MIDITGCRRVIWQIFWFVALMSIPDVGEDADFERMDDLGEEGRFGRILRRQTESARCDKMHEISMRN